MDFDAAVIWQTLPKLLPKLFYVFQIVAETEIISLLLAVPIAVVRIKKVPVISQICEAWLSFIRSMPGIVELFLAYFVLPNVLAAFGISTTGWSLTLYCLIAIVFHYAPFISEIYRPAYLSVDRGQLEAAYSIGFTDLQALIRVMAPQTLPVALPQLGNSLITMITDTSVLFTLGVVDLMGQANIVATVGGGFHKFEIYLAVAVCYWVLVAGAVLLVRGLEKYYERYRIAAGVKGGTA